MKRIQFVANSTIVRNDTNYIGIYLISTGRASVFVKDRDAQQLRNKSENLKKKAKLNEKLTLKEGDVFGDLEFSSNFSKYIVNVVAETDVECILVNTENLESLVFKMHPEVRMNIRERTQVRLLSLISRFGKLHIFTVILQRILELTQEEHRQMRRRKRQKGFRFGLENLTSQDVPFGDYDEDSENGEDLESGASNMISNRNRRKKQIHFAIAQRNLEQKGRLLDVYNSVGNARLSELEMRMNDWLSAMQKYNSNLDNGVDSGLKMGIEPSNVKKDNKSIPL
ncbi:MAG: hypothetical protein MHMPM18_003422, partial [Marteilia pararefringens]